MIYFTGEVSGSSTPKLSDLNLALPGSTRDVLVSEHTLKVFRGVLTHLLKSSVLLNTVWDQEVDRWQSKWSKDAGG